MKRSFIISTVFFLCAFFLISTAEAITVDSVYRHVLAVGGWINSEYESYDLGNFNHTVEGYIEDNIFPAADAYQNSDITIEDNKLILTGTGYAHDYETYAESLIKLDFTIDQNYLLSLSGTLSTSMWNLWSSSYFKLYDDNENLIINKSASYPGTALDESRILPSGAYSLTIEAYDGSFENINLTLEPAASAPIPQSFWLLCSGSILILLYARRQVMA